MTENNEVTNADVTAIRAVIRAFLDETYGADTNAVSSLQKLISDISRLQQVTHVLKFTHPSAHGTNIFSYGNQKAMPFEIGSHVLKHPTLDGICHSGAKYWPIYEFLITPLVHEKSLLDLALAKECCLYEALPKDEAEQFIEVVSGLQRDSDAPMSHSLAKQVYWPIGSNEYHLLSPLFPSSLVNEIYQIFSEHYFSETAQAARKNRKDGVLDSSGYYEYPNLLVQKFGGDQPQNISNLNRKRYRKGENWLLPNCPPKWERQATLQPPKILQKNSIFTPHIFGWQRRVREITKELSDFLAAQADKKSVLWMRERRQRLIAELVDEVLYFASRVQTTFPPGWTRGTGAAHEKLELHPAQQYWLDPYRASPEFDDPEFAAGRCREDWQNTVCEQFAAWVNKNIEVKNKTDMGDPEHEEWKRELRRELRLLRENLDVV